jgi:hypothetical protein
VQRYINNKIGHEFKFDGFHFLLFNLSFKNVKIDDSIFIQKLNIRLNPVKIFTHFCSPLNYVSKINIFGFEFFLNEKFKSYNDMKNKQKLFSALQNSKFTISIDKITLKSKNSSKFLKIENIDILIDYNIITLSSTVLLHNIPIKLNSQLKHIANNVFISSLLFTATNKKTKIFIKSNGIIDLHSLNIHQNIIVDNIEYNGFQLKKSFGILSKKSDIYNINLAGSFGQFEFDFNSDGIIRGKSKIDIAKINNKKISGNINANLEKHNEDHILKLNVSDLSILGFNCSDLSIYGTKKYCGIYDILCAYGSNHNKKKFKIIFLKNGNYKLKFLVNDKSKGSIKGNIKTGAIDVDVRNIAISDTPLILKNTRLMEYVINASGKINNNTTEHIDFEFNNIVQQNIKNNILSATGTLKRNNDKYLFNFYSNNRFIVLGGTVKNCKIVFVNFIFSNLNISNVLNDHKYLKGKISGTSSGYVRYKQNLITEFNIKVFNGKILTNKFDKLEVRGDINLNRINIEHCSMQNSSSKASACAAGVIGFTNKNRFSSVHFIMKNINMGAININGDINFYGKLDKNNNKVNGIIEITKASISGILLNNICADALISVNEFKLYNFRHNIKAFLTVDFMNNKILGDLQFKNTNIKNSYIRTSGFFNLNIKIFGSLNNPHVCADILIINGQYLSQYFSLFSKFDYQNGVININKVLFLAAKSKIFSKENRFNNSAELFTNMFTNFRAYIKCNFWGKGLIEFKNCEKHLKIILQSKNTYIKNIKLDDIKFNIEVINNEITINNISAKILNDKVRISKGFFSVNDGKYRADISLNNVRFGGIDLFGSVNLSGKILRNKGYSGTVNLNDLCINKYKLLFFNFNYVVKNRTLVLFQNPNALKLHKFSGIITFGDVISVQKLDILSGKTSFFLKANFSKNYMDLSVRGSNINWYFMNDVLNLPDTTTGYVNVDANFHGNINNNLNGNISIESINGCIMRIPYDSLELVANFCDNSINIKKASVFKQNEINVSIHGICPLFFSNVLSEKIKTKPINIIYTIEDNRLNILKYLSKGYIKSCCGKMFVKGSFTGTYDNIKNDGKLLISNASFKLKEYLKSKVKNMFAEISFTENFVKIDKFTLESNNGRLDIYGHLRLNNIFHIKDFDIKMLTNKHGIPLYIPQLSIPNFIDSKFLLNKCSTGSPRFDVEIKGSLSKNKVSGWILFENTHFTFPGTLSKSLDKGINSIIANTEFDLSLKSAKNTKFENSFVSALLDGLIHIRGNCDNLETFGVLETSDGKIDYLGLKFNILYAKIEIVDVNQIYVTAECVTNICINKNGEFETVKLIIEKSKLSDLSEKSIKFLLKSNPYIESKKVLKKVMGTESVSHHLITSKFETVANFLIKQQALRFIDQTLTAPVIKTILQKTKLIDGFKIFFIQANSINEKKPKFMNFLLGTRCSLEKNITNRLSLSYSFTIDDFKNKFDLYHELEVQSRFINNLFLSSSCELKLKTPSYNPNRKLMLKYQVRF